MPPARHPAAHAEALPVLYELSLAVRGGLDLRDTCSAFLDVAMARLDFDYASVWVRREVLPDAAGLSARERDGFGLAYASPDSLASTASISALHPLVQRSEDALWSVVAADESAFGQLVMERGVDGGAYVVFRLQDVGLLKLYASASKPQPSLSMAELLCPVIDCFGAAVEACLDHQLDIEEKRRRRHAVSRALRQQRVASIAALAGGVAERFGRALTEILARSASLRDQAPAGGEPAGGEHVDGIAASAAAAQQLCRQLAQLSGPRAADGEGLGAYAPLDLDGVVAQALGCAERRGPGGVRVVSERHGAPPAVRCDADDLGSAFATLMSRAIAASARRGGAVTVRVLPEHVRRQDFVHYPFGTLRQAGDYACVEIEDLGDGMDEAAKAALFEPFAGGCSEGTGLEMAAALGVIRRHGGAVAVESAPGAGTCVRVLLPAASQPRVRHAHERALEQ